MKSLLCILLAATALAAHAEKIALVGATVINPADGKVMPNATVVINGGTIERVGIGKQSAAALGKQIDCAGVTIAAGTDAGNIGTIHGPAIFREFQLMKEAGLTPMQILQCTTANAAKLFGGETGAKIGKIEKGYLADLVFLKSNPLDDIAHASDIDSVMKNGVVYSADRLIQDSAVAH